MVGLLDVAGHVELGGVHDLLDVGDTAVPVVHRGYYNTYSSIVLKSARDTIVPGVRRRGP